MVTRTSRGPGYIVVVRGRLGPCPVCLARPGQSCSEAPGGVGMWGVHSARLDALRADVVGGVRVLRAPGDERAALQVRVSGRYCFRAVIKAPEPGRTLPVVVTIKPSGRRRRAVVPSSNPEVRDGRD